MDDELAALRRPLPVTGARDVAADAAPTAIGAQVDPAQLAAAGPEVVTERPSEEAERSRYEDARRLSHRRRRPRAGDGAGQSCPLGSA